MEDKKIFGSRLAKLRKSIGLSQYKLSESIDIPQSNIANYELGSAHPSYHFLQQLSKVYNANPLFLLNGEGDIFLDGGPKKKTLTEKTIDEINSSFERFADQVKHPKVADEVLGYGKKGEVTEREEQSTPNSTPGIDSEVVFLRGLVQELIKNNGLGPLKRVREILHQEDIEDSRKIQLLKELLG